MHDFSKKISQEYEFTMYNWDFCDQNMSLARLVRWVVARSVVELSAVIVQRTEIKYIYISPPPFELP